MSPSETPVFETSLLWERPDGAERVYLRVFPAYRESEVSFWCPYEVEGSQFHKRGRGPGADSLQALISALVDLAVEVQGLRGGGRVWWLGRSDGYCCLDEIRLRPE